MLESEELFGHAHHAVVYLNDAAQSHFLGLFGKLLRVHPHS